MHREAQREVYEIMGPILFRTCKRYLKKEEEIEDVLAEVFFTLFTKLDQLREDYAFEAWARTITVNQCLLRLRRQVNFNIYIEESNVDSAHSTQPDSGIQEEDLLKLLDILPEGCRTVFNLYAIEGYGHKEISEQLGISEGTSKSQLNVARTKLQNLVNVHYYRQAK
ncbi:sigma-70 family RNA polymerase sigma factor [Flavobacterium sp. SE-s28]|uniref:Sigma-70 family RNA polymerase sigma factor n=2 Tax=Flavobacterium silvaticum TaxID=1852020 RepID=A0A972JIQ8_9FLAO|nr:sigma-70 family RNA polymerase sigma factor [Flavobacterium silvaticum]